MRGPREWDFYQQLAKDTTLQNCFTFSPKDASLLHCFLLGIRRRFASAKSYLQSFEYEGRNVSNAQLQIYGKLLWIKGPISGSRSLRLTSITLADEQRGSAEYMKTNVSRSSSHAD